MAFFAGNVGEVERDGLLAYGGDVHSFAQVRKDVIGFVLLDTCCSIEPLNGCCGFH